MQLLVFILVYPFLWVISIVPKSVFYLFSDVVYFMLYQIVGYRKKVVRKNLRLVFPSRSKADLLLIEKKFYKHLCDTFLEMVKTMSLSKMEMKKRYEVQNIEVLQEIENKKATLLVFSHYANWEWTVSVNSYLTSKGYAVYTRINNVYFDRWLKKVRARWNTVLITQQETVRTIIRNKQNNINGVYGLLSDQSPQLSRAHYWTSFMGIDVPVINGAETMAKKMDLAVVFLKVSKVKRGYYTAEFIPITTEPKSTSEHEITDTFLRLTEQQIYERPEYYLWTHKRWKHRGKTPKKFAKISKR